MEELKSHNSQNLKSVWEIKASIFDVKNKMYAILSTEILKKRLEEMTQKLRELEIQDNQNLRWDMELFKKWEISAEDFRSKRKRASSILENYEEEIKVMKTELRIREIIENNRQVPINDEIQELSKNIENLLWKNIMNGGSNAHWVYMIPGKDFVVIEKSQATFQYIWDLPYYYHQCISSLNIPKVLSVVTKFGKTYLIMERAKWRQMDILSIEEIENIPQEHFDMFINHIHELEKAWLCIDPSKRSNFFYEPNIGFIFIDLSIGKNQLSPEVLEQNILAWLLWNTWLWSKEFRNKIKKAISRK